MPIIAPIPRIERRLMQKTIHKTRDKNHARTLTAMLMLHRGDRVSDVARTLCCARSSVGRWINWFTLSGVEGLKSLPAGRSRRWPYEHICALLRELVKRIPGDFGYQRSRWSTELLAIKINEIAGCQLHAGTVRRWLPSAGLVWRRAAPTLHIRDPHKEEKMAATARVRCCSSALLKHLKATYRRAKTVTLIVDNYIIHKSQETQRWLKENPKFSVIYQPVYSPWVNHVERLWQALHDTITRNH